jgi:hypothetical protein
VPSRIRTFRPATDRTDRARHPGAHAGWRFMNRSRVPAMSTALHGESHVRGSLVVAETSFRLETGPGSKGGTS